VWEDLNANGVQDAGEPGIAGVTVNLFNSAGTQIDTTTTGSNGFYKFDNLAPGTYSVGFGTLAGFGFTTQNTGSNDAIDSDANPTTGRTGTYTLTSGQYNDTVDAGLVGSLHGRTGTIGFWHNSNGQDMIQLLGASWSTYGKSTALGNWLATNFPNLYGSGAGLNSFGGKTTAYIADRFLDLFDISGPKTDAQLLATALAMYTTTNTLNSTADGQVFAQKHGFKLFAPNDPTNLQNTSWNVGANGEAFGVPDNSSVKVFDLIKKVNTYASKGVLYATGYIGSTYYGTDYLRTELNVVFSDINQAGDIISSM